MAKGFRTEIRGIPELKRKLSQLELEAFPRAAARALNRTATTVRAEQARALKERMGPVKISDLKRRIKVRKANPSRLVAQLEYRGRRLNLIAFGGRQLKSGVSAAPWGGRRRFQSAFVIRARNSSKKIVVRRPRRGGTRVGRLPVEAMFGPGVSETAASPELERLREATIRRVLAARLAKEIGFEVDRIIGA